MTMTTDTESTLDGARFEPETPFAEHQPESSESTPIAGFIPWTEAFTPFAEAGGGGGYVASESEALLAEAFADLHEDEFHESLAELVNETAEAVDQRFAGEGPGMLGTERERLGDAHLAPVAFEAEQYLDSLEAGLANLDVSSLSEAQLDEVLNRFDPANVVVSPAGEEFIGGLIRKAKKVVKSVVKTAGKIASAVVPGLTGILKKLKSLVRPLLKRVLAMALNRLPAALQAPARLLAKKFGVGEAEDFADVEAESSSEAMATTPTAVGDPELLAESFDAAMAEAIVNGEALQEQGESFGYEQEDEGASGEAHLEALAGARQDLMARIAAAGDGEDMAPAIEQFVPALLPLLRIGMKIVGRPKVVSFLAKFLSQLIRQWVGPSLATPLSQAIVDVGLRLMTLEQAEPGEAEGEGAAPAVLAATIEDAVRRLAESEDYVFEDEDLLHLAAAEAFEQSVAANFPAQFVRPDLRLAPTLGGSFVTRQARRPFAYKKFSRAPEIEITLPIAQSIKTFGGSTLAAAMAAAGRPLPFRARVHIFESTVGTTIPRVARMEKARGLGSHRRAAWKQLHPLTPEAAGLLLREPKLGVRVPSAFLRSRHRLAAGQRLYYLEPLDGAAAVSSAGAASNTGAGKQCSRPSRATVTIDLIRSEAVIAMYLSEADAQNVAASMRKGNASAALVKALAASYDGVSASFGSADGRVRIIKEHEEGEEFLGSLNRRLAPGLMGALRRKLREWSLKMLAQWARARGQEFIRAADDARCGVTVVLTMKGVPGLSAVRQAMTGGAGLSVKALSPQALFPGMPTGDVAVKAGRHSR